MQPTAPTNTQLPAVIGTAQQGQTLTATNGTWDGSPIGFDYQWQDCDANGHNCTNTGTDTSKYTLPTSGDVGHTIQVIRDRHRRWRSYPSKTSNRTAVVAAPGGSPPFLNGSSGSNRRRRHNQDRDGHERRDSKVR